MFSEERLKTNLFCVPVGLEGEYYDDMRGVEEWVQFWEGIRTDDLIKEEADKIDDIAGIERLKELKREKLLEETGNAE